MYQRVTIPAGIVLLILVARADAGTEVKLTVEEPSGVQRIAWPVTSGVPMAQGALKDDKATALLDPSGQQVPLQTEVLARWPDGSIRWLLLDFQVDLAAGEKKTLELRYGPDVERAAVEDPVRVVKEANGTMVVEPGPVRLEYGSKDDPPFFFPQGSATLIGSDGALGPRLTYNCRYDGVVLRDGRDGYFKPEIGHMTIEQAGPVRACIRFSGSHGYFEEDKKFHYVARIHAWRGQPYVRVHYTLVNGCQDAVMASFDELHASFNVLPNVDRQCILDGEVDAEGQLFQVDENQYLHKDKPAGRRACGWAAAGGKKGGMAVGLREFWQNWPKSISASSRWISLGLFPRLPAGLYDDKPLTEETKLYYYLRDRQYRLKVGAAKTHEFWIRYLNCQPDPDTLDKFFRATEEPLLATCEPAYVSSTKAAGVIPPADPQKFDGYDAALDRALEGHLKRRDQVREYGILNYGDWYGERSVNWGNLEYDLAHGLFLQYLRTGDRRWFFRAEQAARHHIDVDVVHATNPHLKNPWGPPPRVGDVWLHCVAEGPKNSAEA